jgi:hypothetical protein
MSFVKVSTLLSDVASRSGDPSGVEGAYVVEVVQRELQALLGDDAVGNVQAKSYKDGVLTFAVVSNVWAHTIRMQALNIISILKRMHSEIVIISIRYRVENSTNT